MTSECREVDQKERCWLPAEEEEPNHVWPLGKDVSQDIFFIKYTSLESSPDLLKRSLYTKIRMLQERNRQHRL